MFEFEFLFMWGLFVLERRTVIQRTGPASGITRLGGEESGLKGWKFAF